MCSSKHRHYKGNQNHPSVCVGLWTFIISSLSSVSQSESRGWQADMAKGSPGFWVAAGPQNGPCSWSDRHTGALRGGKQKGFHFSEIQIAPSDEQSVKHPHTLIKPWTVLASETLCQPTYLTTTCTCATRSAAGSVPFPKHSHSSYVLLSWGVIFTLVLLQAAQTLHPSVSSAYSLTLWAWHVFGRFYFYLPLFGFDAVLSHCQSLFWQSFFPFLFFFMHQINSIDYTLQCVCVC